MDLDKRIEAMDKWFNSPEGKESMRQYVEKEKKQQEILEGRLERFGQKFGDRLNEVIERLMQKYDSDEYVRKEYKLGYEPRQKLLWFLFEYVERNCEPCQEKKYWNMFTGNAYYVGNYVMQVMHGQGSAIRIDKIEGGRGEELGMTTYYKIDFIKKNWQQHSDKLRGILSDDNFEKLEPISNLMGATKVCGSNALFEDILKLLHEDYIENIYDILKDLKNASK